jgi:hypothetical protein
MFSTGAVPVQCDTNAATEPPLKRRARATNNPLSRANLNTRAGRRVADLYRAYWKALGSPTDAVSQANALACAELKTAAEEARVAVLAGKGDAEQLVRP